MSKNSFYKLLGLIEEAEENGEDLTEVRGDLEREFERQF